MGQGSLAKYLVMSLLCIILIGSSVGTCTGCIISHPRSKGQRHVVHLAASDYGLV